MTLVGAKTFFWPLSKAQKHFFPLLDDALISLFSPFHETFRVFRDATKKCENLSSLPRLPRERKMSSHGSGSFRLIRVIIEISKVQ
jgi:hypothetical protein